MNPLERLVGVAAVVLALSADAATYHVSATSGHDTNDGLTWATAKQSIQAAVDLAVSNDTVLVTNGVYDTGGRAHFDQVLSNRVVIGEGVRVVSVNGPAFTTIEGMGPMGEYAIRCVYLSTGAFLSGFTLTNGHTHSNGEEANQYGGAIYSAGGGASNCVVTDATAVFAGGVFGGYLHACVVSNNVSLTQGGGAWGTQLKDSFVVNNTAGTEGGGLVGGRAERTVIRENSALAGGGAFWSDLVDCELASNQSGSSGGGAAHGSALRCRVYGNKANGEGGGLYSLSVTNCQIWANTATVWGGGVAQSVVFNSVISGNAADSGGGAAYSMLYASTVTDNSAAWAGGVRGGTHRNSIIYHNGSTSFPNHAEATFLYSCTTPAPGGEGNITNDPRLASTFRLSLSSPCLGAGSTSWVSGVDVDGEAWLVPPVMGCDERFAAGLTGALTVAIRDGARLYPAGYTTQFVASIEGAASSNVWEFGDGTSDTNRLAATHVWATTGIYEVIARAYNADNPAGVAATAMVIVVSQVVHHVRRDSATPIPPYAYWSTAATSIQDAVDVAVIPGSIVLVTNGVYDNGSRITPTAPLLNRLAVSNRIVVQSVNGPAATIISGVQSADPTNAMRCVYLDGKSILNGFTLTRGMTAVNEFGDSQIQGGGAYLPDGVLVNCIVVSNTAELGGGVAQGAISNCVIVGNTANYGGGAYECKVYSSVIAGNTALNQGGGMFGTEVHNGIVVSNSAPSANNWRECWLYFSCVGPNSHPGAYAGCVTGDPQFVDYAAGDLHLLSNSICIDAGEYIPGSADSTDLDGQPRIRNLAIDIGAYEFQGAAIARSWLQAHGLPTDGSAVLGGNDDDGFNNWQEYLAGSHPTNGSSYLGMLVPSSPGAGVTGLVVRWQGSTGRTYQLERALDLTDIPAFSLIMTNVPGQTPATVVTDSTATADGPYLYRVYVTP